MELDPETKIDMSLDDIIYHEQQRQAYIDRMLHNRRTFRQNNYGYHGNGMGPRNAQYRRTPNWYTYRSSLNRVKWFYQGQKYFSYRSRFQNWNRVKNWAAQQRYSQDEEVQDYEADETLSDCQSTFSSASKRSRRNRKRFRRAPSSVNLSIASRSSSVGFKRPEIPYSSPKLGSLSNLVIKINNVGHKNIGKKFSQKEGRPMTLNERFSCN